MISINQDVLGVQCRRIKTGIVDILVKPLDNSKTAVCVFNKSGSEKNAEIDLNKTAELSFINLAKKDEYRVTDVWTDAEFTSGLTINARVPAHGVKVYIIE